VRVRGRLYSVWRLIFNQCALLLALRCPARSTKQAGLYLLCCSCVDLGGGQRPPWQARRCRSQAPAVPHALPQACDRGCKRRQSDRCIVELLMLALIVHAFHFNFWSTSLPSDDATRLSAAAKGNDLARLAHPAAGTWQAEPIRGKLSAFEQFARAEFGQLCSCEQHTQQSENDMCTVATLTGNTICLHAQLRAR